MSPKYLGHNIPDFRDDFYLYMVLCTVNARIKEHVDYIKNIRLKIGQYSTTYIRTN